ncbi:MAG: alpha/beta fold hydrolase, partial [Xanthomonadales bacterium]|nr:alpha/beta fold hydrolase [Xanthomonadales bacterium]
MNILTGSSAANAGAGLAILGAMLLSLPVHPLNEDRAVNWTEIQPVDLEHIPYRDIGAVDLTHPVERRGLVEVPLDYDRPDGPRLKIFYRLLPRTGGRAASATKPVLVIMNGGPGVPSSAYRSLDFDYGGGQTDALSGLAQHFRLLLVDQRGTGNSSPLDLDAPSLPAAVIARFFDSDEHALDHARVIEKVIPGDEPFFILARSYGGEIGFQYLLAGERVRRPAGMVFSSAILPHTDALESFLARREEQRQLNLQFSREVPSAIEKLDRLRQRAVELGLDAGAVNFLWADLGGPAGWAQALDEKIDRLLRVDDPEALATALGGTIVQSVNLLNYVLSSAALTPGFTDRTITMETSRRIAFEPWMLDENWTLNQLGADGGWRARWIESIDRAPPPPTSFPDAAVIRRALATTHILFTFGTEDAFIPGQVQMKRARDLAGPVDVGFVMLEG